MSRPTANKVYELTVGLVCQSAGFYLDCAIREWARGLRQNFYAEGDLKRAAGMLQAIECHRMVLVLWRDAGDELHAEWAIGIHLWARWLGHLAHAAQPSMAAAQLVA